MLLNVVSDDAYHVAIGQKRPKKNIQWKTSSELAGLGTARVDHSRCSDSLDSTLGIKADAKCMYQIHLLSMWSYLE